MMKENEIGNQIVDAAIKVHRTLGPGLLENVYEIILAHELKNRGLDIARQVPIRILYDGIVFDEGYRADLIVNNKVIVELKSVSTVLPVHKKQVQTYIKLADLRLGYLLNFGAELMKHGITRVVNKLEE